MNLTSPCKQAWNLVISKSFQENTSTALPPYHFLCFWKQCYWLHLSTYRTREHSSSPQIICTIYIVNAFQQHFKISRINQSINSRKFEYHKMKEMATTIKLANICFQNIHIFRNMTRSNNKQHKLSLIKNHAYLYVW